MKELLGVDKRRSHVKVKEERERSDLSLSSCWSFHPAGPAPAGSDHAGSDPFFLVDMGENSKIVMIPVTFKGANYLLWESLAKTALGGRGLWEVVEEGKNPKKTILGEDGKEVVVVDTSDKKRGQEDLMVLSIIQNSLESSILEAYSYCETSKQLWDTLKKVYGNISSLNRVFEVKRAINTLSQEDTDFTKHFGKFRSLWAELEMLRPATLDPYVLNERREQDKVFALLFTLNPGYSDLIKHILRSEKLPSLDDVCAQIQKEQGSVGLFGGKGELIMANQAEEAENKTGGVANKGFYKPEDKKIWVCDHCKKKGHGKDKCWILHPHLKPQKFRTPYADARANFSGEIAEPSTPKRFNATGEGKTLSFSGCSAVRTAPDESIKKSDLDALIKAHKESGNTLGISLSASYKSPSALVTSLKASHGTNNVKPLVIDSGASHHMISDARFISTVEPVLGIVMIANGDKIPIKGVGTLKLFDKDTKSFYMPTFASNLLSVKRATTDLNCNVNFSPNEVVFQDIETLRLIGKGVTKEDLDVKFVESRGYYEEKSWDKLKDLSQTASGRADNLRRIMESLGISMPQSNQEPRSTNNQESGHDQEEGQGPETMIDEVDQAGDDSHPDPEGGSQGEPHTDQVHDEDERPQQETVEQQTEAGSDGNEQSIEAAQPLRRSTRLRKHPSNWINTRVYFNSQAVAHPIQAVCVRFRELVRDLSEELEEQEEHEGERGRVRTGKRE
ncbi:hypothetical protein N665_2202s0003 [Sinapis alba]|nr:hypothetical protein N665_2202s0003 [Sinapis alba]